jgi:AcrR family transcriptional regulator
MNRITKVKRPKRSYESALRQDQTEATRTRILDALVRTMAKGVAGLSVPAVAREAGVSVPTMYRYFKTKADLVAALAPYLVGKAGLMEIPKEADDLGTVVRELYRRNEAMDLETRAALASELGQEVRRRTMPQRVAMIRAEIARWTPGLAGEDLDRFTRVMLILGSSATMRAYKDYLGLGAMAAADDVVWALEALQRALRRKRS